MDSTAAVIGALGGLGIESYEIANGAPVSTTSVAGIATVQTGAAVSQTSLFLILGILAAGILVYFVIH